MEDAIRAIGPDQGCALAVALACVLVSCSTPEVLTRQDGVLGGNAGGHHYVLCGTDWCLIRAAFVGRTTTNCPYDYCPDNYPSEMMSLRLRFSQTPSEFSYDSLLAAAVFNACVWCSWGYRSMEDTIRFGPVFPDGTSAAICPEKICHPYTFWWYLGTKAIAHVGNDRLSLLTDTGFELVFVPCGGLPAVSP